MIQYPVELMVVFIFGLSGMIVAAFAGLIMVRDLDAWKLKPDKMLASIIYMVRNEVFFFFFLLLH